MSEFIYLPSYSANLTTEVNVRKSGFGDGYQQRAVKGINNKKRIWDLRFTGKTGKIDLIESFLREHGGVMSFDWSPPSGLTGKWICSDWPRAIEGYNKEVLTAKFEEVFGE